MSQPASHSGISSVVSSWASTMGPTIPEAESLRAVMPASGAAQERQRGGGGGRGRGRDNEMERVKGRNC